MSLWCDPGNCALGLMVWLLQRTFDTCSDCRLRDLGWTQSSFSLEEALIILTHTGLGLDLPKVSSSVGKWYLHRVTAECGNLELLLSPGGPVGDQITQIRGWWQHRGCVSLAAGALGHLQSVWCHLHFSNQGQQSHHRSSKEQGVSTGMD